MPQLIKHLRFYVPFHNLRNPSPSGAATARLSEAPVDKKLKELEVCVDSTFPIRESTSGCLFDDGNAVGHNLHEVVALERDKGDDVHHFHEKGESRGVERTGNDFHHIGNGRIRCESRRVQIRREDDHGVASVYFFVDEEPRAFSENGQLVGEVESTCELLQVAQCEFAS